jgi:hypothetical protein
MELSIHYYDEIDKSIGDLRIEQLEKELKRREAKRKQKENKLS